MAITATAVWEIRSTATAGNTNGGFFKTGATGTDFSQQNAAQYALTGIATSGAGAVFNTALAAADMVGNGCYIVSGTNFTVGWYEITSVSVGVSVTVDRACCTGVGASGVINIGGAMSLGSTLDDELFEAFVGGNTVYVKNGTYTIGESISVASVSSTAIVPVNLIGYDATRGDDPRGSTRPLFACAANTLVFGQFWIVRGIQCTITTAGGLTMGTGGALNYCKVINTSPTGGRSAVSPVSECTLLGCEFVSLAGQAVTTALGLSLSGCYIHDSATGVLTGTGTGRFSIVNCIFETIRDVGVDFALTSTGAIIESSTFYGVEAKSPGLAIRLGASTANVRLYNNIFYGWATGVGQTGSQLKANYGAYNCFFNNTANASLYTLDSTDITLDPEFVGASQINGSTATTSGSVLTQPGGDFSSVTDNVDIVRVVSGTGVTTGRYIITSHTSDTITVSSALGTSSAGNVVWVITVGHNFQVGANMKAAGYPGAFSGSESTGYLDIGGVQRQEPGGGGGGVF